MRLAALGLCLALAPAAAPGQGRNDSRYKAPLSVGLRLGGLAGLGTVAGGTPTAVGGGVYGLFDLQALLADAALDVFAGSNANSVAGGIGAYYAFLPENITPYAGGGVKLAWTRFGGEGATGLQLFGAVGLLASRQWSPHVRVELAWFFDTMGERPRGGGPVRYANGPIATLGLGF